MHICAPLGQNVLGLWTMQRQRTTKSSIFQDWIVGLPSVKKRQISSTTQAITNAARVLGVDISSIEKIKEMVDSPKCGHHLAYQTIILVGDKYFQGEDEFRIYEGTHRMCALWKRFSQETPAACAAFVAE